MLDIVPHQGGLLLAQGPERELRGSLCRPGSRGGAAFACLLPHLQFPACNQEEERWGEASNGEDDPKEKTLPEDPETCLQLNMVYQEVIQERLVEVSLLLAQNQEQQVGQGLALRTPMARHPRTGL